MRPFLAEEGARPGFGWATIPASAEASVGADHGEGTAPLPVPAPESVSESGTKPETSAGPWGHGHSIGLTNPGTTARKANEGGDL